MAEWSGRVAASSDDAEELDGTTDVNINGSALDVGRDMIGLRWAGVSVPKNAVISDASITFTSTAGDSGSFSLSVVAEASDSAATFAATSANLSGRSTTAQSALYSISDSWVTDGTYVFAAGTFSSHLKNVIQAIVNRAGWVAGNALVLMSYGGSGIRRRAYSYDNDPAKAPLLTITYEATDVTVNGNVGSATVTALSGQVVPGEAVTAGNVGVATVNALQGSVSENIKVEGHLRAVTVQQLPGQVVAGAASVAGNVGVATVNALRGRAHYNLYADRVGVAGGGALVEIYR